MLRQVTREIVEEKHEVTGRGRRADTQVESQSNFKLLRLLLPSLPHPTAFLPQSQSPTSGRYNSNETAGANGETSAQQAYGEGWIADGAHKDCPMQVHWTNRHTKAPAISFFVSPTRPAEKTSSTVSPPFHISPHSVQSLA